MNKTSLPSRECDGKDAGDDWSRIARAYVEVVVPSTPHKELMRAMEAFDQGGAALDLGCGPGELMRRLLSKERRQVAGVDANEHMIDYANLRLVTHYEGLYTLHHADATTFDDGKNYRNVFSSNTLFTVREPERLLVTAYNHLRKGGLFVLTSSRPNPDIGAVAKAVQEDYRARGLLGERKKEMISTVLSVNKQFEHKMHHYEIDEISLLLKSVGFSSIIHASTVYVNNSNFLVVARR